MAEKHFKKFVILVFSVCIIKGKINIFQVMVNLNGIAEEINALNNKFNNDKQPICENEEECKV